MRDAGVTLGLDVASESALAAGLVMGVMIIPFVSSLSDDAITAVPQSLREGSFGLGATRSETIRLVILPAALPGIAGAVLLAVSRAIGETMIVVMAAGLAANLTANPLEAVTTVTVQIVTLLTGDQEFDSAKTLSAFALGLVLFCRDARAQRHRAARGAALSGRSMTEPGFASRWSSPAMQERLRRRYRAERRFRALGLAAIGIALTALVLLLVSIAARGWSAFVRTELRLDVPLDASFVAAARGRGRGGARAGDRAADWAAPLREALLRRFPEVTERRQVRELAALVSSGGARRSFAIACSATRRCSGAASRSGCRRTTRSTWS